MKKHFRLSKGLHVLTLCCFLMPFFYSSCDKNRDGKTEEEATEIDTTSLVESINPDSVPTMQIANANQADKKKKDDSFSDNDSLFKSFPILRPFLNPDKDCYSGVGIMITHFSMAITSLVFTCFLLLLLSLTIKFIDSNARKAIVLLEMIATIALSVAQPFSTYHERLWGLYVCLTFLIILTIYDIYIARLYKKQNLKGST